MNSTSGWCVIAHSDRLKRFMTLLRGSRSAGFDRADLEARFELLHAQRDDLVAVADAGGDERRSPR